MAHRPLPSRTAEFDRGTGFNRARMPPLADRFLSVLRFEESRRPNPSPSSPKQIGEWRFTRSARSARTSAGSAVPSCHRYGQPYSAEGWRRCPLAGYFADDMKGSGRYGNSVTGCFRYTGGRWVRRQSQIRPSARYVVPPATFQSHPGPPTGPIRWSPTPCPRRFRCGGVLLPAADAGRTRMLPVHGDCRDALVRRTLAFVERSVFVMIYISDCWVPGTVPGHVPYEAGNSNAKTF